MIGGLGVKMYCFPPATGFSCTGWKYDETVWNTVLWNTGNDVSGREDVATTGQKGAGGGETERSMNPGYRRRWREVRSVL